MLGIQSDDSIIKAHQDSLNAITIDKIISKSGLDACTQCGHNKYSLGGHVSIPLAVEVDLVESCVPATMIACNTCGKISFYARKIYDDDFKENDSHLLSDEDISIIERSISNNQKLAEILEKSVAQVVANKKVSDAKRRAMVFNVMIALTIITGIGILVAIAYAANRLSP